MWLLHENVFTVLYWFEYCREASLVNIQLQLVSEGALGHNRKAMYVCMDARIGVLWDHYDDHNIVCEEFLKDIGEVVLVDT